MFLEAHSDCSIPLCSNLDLQKVQTVFLEAHSACSNSFCSYLDLQKVETVFLRGTLGLFHPLFSYLDLQNLKKCVLGGTLGLFHHPLFLPRLAEGTDGVLGGTLGLFRPLCSYLDLQKVQTVFLEAHSAALMTMGQPGPGQNRRLGWHLTRKIKLKNKHCVIQLTVPKIPHPSERPDK